MTFEEAKTALSNSGYSKDCEYEINLLAIELMKADAMQKQAVAINELKNLLSGCMTTTSFSGSRVFTIRIDAMQKQADALGEIAKYMAIRIGDDLTDMGLYYTKKPTFVG